MIVFTCPRCNTEYQYPDAMAGNKIRCTGSNCNQKLLVPPPTAPPTVVAPPAPIASIMPSGPSERLWNYMESGQAQGPVPASELKHLIAARRMAPKDLVWTAGMSAWRPVQEALPEMFRKPAGTRPRRDAEAEDDKRGGLFEKIGVGVFAVVAAAILVGLFMILFPLIHNAAAHTPTVAVAAGDNATAGADAGQEMKPEQVSAHCEPSVALIKTGLGSGSGFLVDKWFVVTNSHVIADDTIAGIDVLFPSTDHKDQKYKVRLVYEDRKRDLAILQLQETPPTTALPLFAGKAVKNQEVVVIGSPGIGGAEGGLSVNSSYSGHLNNVDLTFEMNGIEGERKQVSFSQIYYQYDSQTNPGNSGGPLLNMHGEVIAVHDAHQHETGARLAIPGPDLRTAFDKAAARKQDAIDRANAIHDAHCLTAKLEKVAESYLNADDFCATKGQEAEKDGKSAGKAFFAAQEAIKALQKKDIQEAQQTGREPNFLDPEITRRIFLDPEFDQIPDLLSSSALDDDVRSKLHQLRDLYLKAKGIYEAPSGMIDDIAHKVNQLTSEYAKLADAIDAEFGFVF